MVFALHPSPKLLIIDIIHFLDMFTGIKLILKLVELNLMVKFLILILDCVNHATVV